MVEVPKDEITEYDLQVWEVMKRNLQALQLQERELRARIFRFYFPTPKEGTNTHPLANHYNLKGTHVIDRQVDQAAYTALVELFEEKDIKHGTLLRYKPELVVKEYRKLTDEQTRVFDRCLIVKPGSPQLEIALDKRAAGSA